MNLKELVQNHWTKLASVGLAFVVLSLLDYFNSSLKGFALIIGMPGMTYFYWLLFELHFKRLTLGGYFSELKASPIPPIILFTILLAPSLGDDLPISGYFLELAASVFYVKAAKKCFTVTKDWIRRPRPIPGLRYALAVTLCLIIIVVHTLIGSCLGWKGGGGLIVLVPLFFALKYTWGKIINPKINAETPSN